jgi:hypothetical protein
MGYMSEELTVMYFADWFCGQPQVMKRIFNALLTQDHRGGGIAREHHLALDKKARTIT